MYVVAVHPCARFRSLKRTLYAKCDAGGFRGLVWVFVRGELNRYRSMERYRARPINNLVNILQEELALTIKIGAGVRSGLRALAERRNARLNDCSLAQQRYAAIELRYLHP